MPRRPPAQIGLVGGNPLGSRGPASGRCPERRPGNCSTRVTRQFIEQRHGLQDGFDFVVTVVAPAQNLQVEIHLGRSPDDDRPADILAALGVIRPSFSTLPVGPAGPVVFEQAPPGRRASCLTSEDRLNFRRTRSDRGTLSQPSAEPPATLSGTCEIEIHQISPPDQADILWRTAPRPGPGTAETTVPSGIPAGQAGGHGIHGHRIAPGQQDVAGHRPAGPGPAANLPPDPVHHDTQAGQGLPGEPDDIGQDFRGRPPPRPCPVPAPTGPATGPPHRTRAGPDPAPARASAG